MTLQPLLTAPALVQAHTLFAVAALVSGAAILLLPKGTPQHRMMGRFAALSLVITALSSFGIVRGGLSVIHLLSVVTLVSVSLGVVAIRQGNRTRHAAAMRGAWFGLVGAALFTLLPGRVMNSVFFGG